MSAFGSSKPRRRRDWMMRFQGALWAVLAFTGGFYIAATLSHLPLPF